MTHRLTRKRLFRSLRHGALLGALLLAACATAPPRVPKTQTQALAPVADTASARYIQSQVTSHPGRSGFRLVTKSPDALLSRVVLADHAAHSLDLQYYIFANDATGRLLAQRLLAAADRGVRVRLLVDDAVNGDANDLLRDLATHPKIEVRLFNPFRTLNPSLPSKIAQFALEGRRLNRRMHNKSFIADGWVAVIGGRNIGDPYFDAAEQGNFRDLDVLAIGPVVHEAQNTFDAYWNSDAAVPVHALAQQPSTAEVAVARSKLLQDARAFAQSDYAQALLDNLPEGPSADRRDRWLWGDAQLVADSPQKVEVQHDDPALRIGPRLRNVFDAAAHEVDVITPYFVPGKRGTQYFVDLTQRGVSVNILTNSLASTDEPAVHVGYSRYREPLLAGGVHLFELRPQPGEPQPATAGGTSAGDSLHAKAAVVDDRYVFVGSMNMDQRSKLLNTEMGVIIDCPELARDAHAYFTAATAPGVSFSVSLEPGAMHSHLVWRARDQGEPVTLEHEPGPTAKRRIEVALIKLLPIEGLL